MEHVSNEQLDNSMTWAFVLIILMICISTFSIIVTVTDKCQCEKTEQVSNE